MDEKGKKPIWKTWWLWLIIVLLFLIISSFGDENSPSNNAGNPPSSNESVPVSQTATWQQVATWDGNGTKNTETFHIQSNEWRINWSTEPGEYGDMNFQIFIYNTNNNPIGVAANVIGQASDVSYMRGSGDYYLSINSGQPYQIIVEEKK